MRFITVSLILASWILPTQIEEVVEGVERPQKEVV